MKIRRPTLRRLPAAVLRQLLESEASGGLILMAVAALAIVIANSPAAPIYFDALKTYVGPLSVLHWINDALMAVFFLLVGLEIKREFVEGELSTWSRRSLPGIAAAGGMVAPALIYIAFNTATADTLRGWAIPTATDIAFALGVLTLLGPRVPISLKIFLTALAIIDDLGAVAIIAVFYTANISVLWLALAGLTLALLAALNWMGVARLPVFLALGAMLWFFTLKSGVHATIAGVALALTVPLRPSQKDSDDASSPLLVLEHALNPWVAFLVVPVFGFANAGLSLSGLSLMNLLDPVPLGVAAGLFLGKQAGVFLSIWTSVKLKLAEQPRDASLAQIYGVSLLCGIGFTMSLFIGLLSFPYSAALQDEVKIGVLLGSLLSAVIGALVLRLASSRRVADSVDD